MYGDPQYQIVVDLIKVNDCCPTKKTCDFTPFFKIEGCNPVQFWDFSNGPNGVPIAWYWDFGDGSFSNLQNPTHPYTSQRLYHVCLIVVWQNTTNGETGLKRYCQDVKGCPDADGANKTEMGDKIQNEDLFILPNPARNIVKVFTSDILNPIVKIYDLNGKVLLSSKRSYNGNKKVIIMNTTSLSPGVYIVKILGEDRIVAKKLVIQ